MVTFERSTDMRSLAAAILALTATAASAQFSETLEVRVVNVDVVVTDRDGKPVPRLTKPDFEVLEDGKAQTITNFYEVAAGQPGSTSSGAAPTATVEPRPRRFVFFIDSETLYPAVRKEVFASLRKFVDTQLRAGDLASVVNWDRGLKIAAPLTSDRAVINAAIDALDRSPSPLSVQIDLVRVERQCMNDVAMIKTNRMAPQIAYSDCIATVHSETERAINTSKLLMNAINVTLTTLAGVEGKKILVVAGAYLPQSPGAEMFNWANQLFQTYMRGYDAPTANNLEEAREQRGLLDRLAKSASAHGVTLYALDVPVAMDETVHIERQTSTIGSGEFFRIGNTAASFTSLAEATGGLAMIRPLNFDAAFSTIGRDLDAYYSLGYRPPDATRRERAIVVRTKNRAYTVRNRKSYAPKSADDQMTDRVIANIYTPATSEWPIRLRTGALARGEGDKFVVPIEVTIPSTLTLMGEGDQLAGGYTVYVAVGSPFGALSTTFRSPQPVTTTRAEEAAFRREPLVFGANLSLRPGENLVSVGVVDHVGRTSGFARTTVTAGQ